MYYGKIYHNGPNNGKIYHHEFFDLPPSENLNKEVKMLEKFPIDQVFYSTKKEPVQDFDPDTYML